MNNNNIWNLCANIKNGLMVRHKFVLYNHKKNYEPFLKILWNEGFILGYTICTKTDKIKINLKYKSNGSPAINSIKLLSKPSMRLYYSTKQLWKIDSNNSFIIMSTNQGLKSITECKKLNIGGEPLAVLNKFKKT